MVNDIEKCKGSLLEVKKGDWMYREEGLSNSIEFPCKCILFISDIKSLDGGKSVLQAHVQMFFTNSPEILSALKSGPNEFWISLDRVSKKPGPPSPFYVIG